MSLVKSSIRNLFRAFGLDIKRYRTSVVTTTVLINDAITLGIPDQEFYHPYFSPWLGYGDYKQLYEEVQPFTLLNPLDCHFLYYFATQCTGKTGEIWECGVYKGGTAMLLEKALIRAGDSKTILRLFDTFAGMPNTDPEKDWHKQGDFADTSIQSVKDRIKGANVAFHQGYIPETFAGLEESVIAFAHVDVDIYKSIIDCCEFIFPRLLSGGIILFDDYGRPTCAGARKAVDDFFRDRAEIPIVLPTGQALIIKK